MPIRVREIRWLYDYLHEKESDQNRQIACTASWDFGDWLHNLDGDELAEWGVTFAQRDEWVSAVEDGECWELAYNGVFPEAMLAAYRERGSEVLMRDTPEEAPSFLYFMDPRLLDQPWLVHFTDTDRIAFQGFRVGVSDPAKLGLTTLLGQWDKREPGYNFAFTPHDAKRYAVSGWGEYKYGDQAYLFRVPSAVNVFHFGDEERQTIFWGPSASWIVPLVQPPYSDDPWGIEHPNIADRMLVTGDFSDLAHWLENHGMQYRRLLFAAAQQRQRRQRRSQR
jgi:hypothetical protein